MTASVMNSATGRSCDHVSDADREAGLAERRPLVPVAAGRLRLAGVPGPSLDSQVRLVTGQALLQEVSVSADSAKPGADDGR